MFHTPSQFIVLLCSYGILVHQDISTDPADSSALRASTADVFENKGWIVRLLKPFSPLLVLVEKERKSAGMWLPPREAFPAHPLPAAIAECAVGMRWTTCALSSILSISVINELFMLYWYNRSFPIIGNTVRSLTEMDFRTQDRICRIGCRKYFRCCFWEFCDEVVWR